MTHKDVSDIRDLAKNAVKMENFLCKSTKIGSPFPNNS